MKGCEKGSKWQYLHVKLCPNSKMDDSCLKDNCCHPHFARNPRASLPSPTRGSGPALTRVSAPVSALAMVPPFVQSRAPAPAQKSNLCIFTNKLSIPALDFWSNRILSAWDNQEEILNSCQVEIQNHSQGEIQLNSLSEILMALSAQSTLLNSLVL